MKHKLFSKDSVASAMAFAISQASHIEAGVNRAIYPDIQYKNLIPVDTSAHPFAKTVTYFSSDQYGKAEWINGNSDDVPVAGSEMEMHETKVHMAAIGYAIGYEEANQAQMLGHNLQGEDAMAARRGYEEMVDRVALYGDTSKGFTGLINAAGVAANGVGKGDWANAAEDDILADINAELLGVATDTQYASLADTLALPYDKLNILATRRLGDNTITVLEFIRKNNTYTAMTGKPLTIRAVRGLETAGVGSSARMIAYRNSPDVLKLHIPMPHRFLPMYQDGPLNFVVPGVFRIGGTDVRRKKEVRYGDGI